MSKCDLRISSDGLAIVGLHVRIIDTRLYAIKLLGLRFAYAICCSGLR